MPALFHGYGAVDISSCTALAVARGVTVVLPRRPRQVALRISHTWVAILPPAAFLATVAGLAMHPSLALAVIAIACIGVPVLGALAIAAFARGGSLARALVVLPLLVLAGLHAGVAGQLAVLTLVMLSCVALGSLLAAAAGVRELVVAAVLVVALDLVLLHAGGIRVATAALLDARLGHVPDFAQPVLGAHDHRLRRLLRGRAGRRHRGAPGRRCQTARRPGHHRLRAALSTRSLPTATCCLPPSPSRSRCWWPRPSGACAAGGARRWPRCPPFSSLN